jgi:gas vesicle protein
MAKKKTKKKVKTIPKKKTAKKVVRKASKKKAAKKKLKAVKEKVKKFNEENEQDLVEVSNEPFPNVEIGREPEANDRVEYDDDEEIEGDDFNDEPL